MRSLVLLLAVLVLGGCMNVSDMAEGTRYHMSDAGLLDHSDSRRANNLRIQPDSFVYIAQGAFAPPGSAYPRPNVIAEVAFDGFCDIARSDFYFTYRLCAASDRDNSGYRIRLLLSQSDP